MRRASFLIAAVAAATLALTPAGAFARAGSKSSFGSRGSMTYSPPPPTRTAPMTAAPMERSATPSMPASPAYGNTGAGRSGFMSGLFGGLVGAGIGGLLFGGGLFGGMSGFGGFLGLLLQILLLVMLGRFLLRMFLRPSALAGAPGYLGRSPPPPRGPLPRSAPSGRPQVGRVAVSDADFREFQRLLTAIQAAWSSHDVNALRQSATPEMVGYLSEQLAEQASRGVRNVVSNVRLEQGDLSEAWAEGGREYATVAMRFSMTDATYDQSGRLVDGSANERVTATEVWTFVRALRGRWVLSAIQQTG